VIRASNPLRPVARAWCSAAIAIIALATLSPQVGSANLRQGFFAPFTDGAIGAWLDVAQNVLLYVPFGLVLAIRGVSWLRTTVAAAGLSLSIELCQFLVPGRDPVATDIVVNTIGASIAWLFRATRIGALANTGLIKAEHWLARAARPSADAAASLSLSWALVVSLVVAATCVLMSVNLPEPYYFLVSSPLMDDVAGPVHIGAAAGSSGYFEGVIDDVRIYSNPRSPDAIRADMQSRVVAYGFDAPGGETTVDSTGRGHDAVVRGATWTPDGKFGGAYAFDGRTSEILVPGFAALHVTSAITIEAWVNPAKRQPGIAAIVSHTADTYFLRASSENGTLSPAGGGRFGENPIEARLRRSVPAGEWIHLAVSYDGQTITLYVNAEPVVQRRHWSTHRPLTASIADIDLAAGFVLSPSRLRGILAGAFAMNLRLRCGEPQTEPGQVFSIVGVQSIESNARSLGLAPVDYRIPEALSNCQPGSMIDLTLKGPLQRPQLADRQGKPFRTIEPGLGSAWAFLFDSRLLPPRIVATISWVFLAALMLPFGFWARPRVHTIAGGLMLIAVVSSVPSVMGTPPVDVYQALGLLTGVAAGLLLRTTSH
jgi:hypothetical protein